VPETLTISIELTETEDGVDARGRFELLGNTYRARAHAPEIHRDHRVAHDLAVARVIRGLEVELLNQIHEQIDRYIADE